MGTITITDLEDLLKHNGCNVEDGFSIQFNSLTVTSIEMSMRKPKVLSFVITKY